MLPLLRLNVNSFGKGNLENVYITTSMQVVVKVKEVNMKVLDNPSYVTDYEEEEDGYNYIIYQLDEVWGDDFLYYTKGMYSKMTDFAKDLIKQGSGLLYNKYYDTIDTYDEDGKFVGRQKRYETDPRLRALDKCEILRARLEKDLGVKIHKDAELLSKISESEFITI